MASSPLQPGSPRISSATLQIQSTGVLRLTIRGNELNPDPQEAPVVQVFGVQTQCAGPLSISSTARPSRSAHGRQLDARQLTAWGQAPR